MPQTIDNMIATWNNAGTTFTALKFNVTDTASNAASLLMDLQVGGSSQFNVSKAGRAYSAQFYIHPTQNTGLAGNFTEPRILAQNNTLVTFGLGGMKFVAPIGFTSGDPAITAADVFLGRRAAANLRLGSADAAGSAIAINSVASNQLTLASAHGLTTGAAVIITGTAAPSGTTLNVRYYARVIAAAVIELYSTYDQATAASGTTGIIAVTTAGTSASVRLATPFQSFGVQDFTGTDIPGQPFIIRGSRGTGTGAGGDIIFQVAPAGTAGSSQNALATALTIGGDRNVTIDNASAVLQINRSGTSKIVSYVDGGSLNSVNLASDVGLSWNSTTTATGSFDLAIFRDASNTLALRRGTNPQTFNVYNTFTDASNYERASFGWSSNIFNMLVGAAGTGTQRGVAIGMAGSGGFINFWAGTPVWQITSGGTFQAVTDNVYDIGTSSGSRPRNVYVAGSLYGAAYLDTLRSNNINNYDNTKTVLTFTSGSDNLLFATGGTAPRINFCGTTSSFPAIKRSSTTLQARLADDSAFASVQGKLTTDTAYTAGAPTATGYLVLYDSTGTAYKIPAVAV